MELNIGRPLSHEETRVVDDNMFMIDPTVVKSTALQLGPVLLKLKRKSAPTGAMRHHIMSRKGTTDATSVPRFGIFCGAVKHTGPHGVDNMFVSVKWLKQSPELYHKVIRAPLAMAGFEEAVPSLYLARDIAPFLCFGARDLSIIARRRPRLIMLTEKTWSCLTMLGFPKIP